MLELCLPLKIGHLVTANIYYREPSPEELADAWEKTIHQESDTEDTYNSRMLITKNDLGQELITRIEINGEDVDKQHVPLLLIALGHYLIGNLAMKEGRV